MRKRRISWYFRDRMLLYIDFRWKTIDYIWFHVRVSDEPVFVAGCVWRLDNLLTFQTAKENPITLPDIATKSGYLWAFQRPVRWLSCGYGTAWMIYFMPDWMSSRRVELELSNFKEKVIFRKVSEVTMIFLSNSHLNFWNFDRKLLFHSPANSAIGSLSLSRFASALSAIQKTIFLKKANLRSQKAVISQVKAVLKMQGPPFCFEEPPLVSIGLAECLEAMTLIFTMNSGLFWRRWEVWNAFLWSKSGMWNSKQQWWSQTFVWGNFWWRIERICVGYIGVDVFVKLPAACTNSEISFEH
jgi:hypothetical protein